MTAAAPPRVVHTLSDAQKAVFASDARFRVLIAGRRFGKSYLACLAMMTQAINTRDTVSWYVAPTYRQGKEILWALLKKLTPQGYVAAANESDLSMRLTNGSVMAIRGADNPDSLRGVGVDLVCLDEFAFMQKRVWDEAIRPMLSDRTPLGRALFITTPQGMNWAYDLYLKGQEQIDGFRSWTFKSLDGGHIPADEIEAARNELSPRQFRQEYEASFEALSGRVYDNFDRQLNVDASIVDLPTQELLVGMDFNVNPMSVVLGVKAGDQLHIFDAIEVATSNTEEVAQMLRQRYPNRRVIVCPDPSGNARKTSAAVGQTDFTILQRQGFYVDAAHKAPLISDRINAVQALLKDAAGTRRLLVHPKARAVVRALDGLTYKEDTNIPDKGSGLDHMADALGYLVWQRFNLLETRRAIVRNLYA